MIRIIVMFFRNLMKKIGMYRVVSVIDFFGFMFKMFICKCDEFIINRLMFFNIFLCIDNFLFMFKRVERLR